MELHNLLHVRQLASQHRRHLPTWSNLPHRSMPAGRHQRVLGRSTNDHNGSILQPMPRLLIRFVLQNYQKSSQDSKISTQKTGNVPHESNCTLYHTCSNGEIADTHACDTNGIFIEDECISGNQLSCQPDFSAICSDVFFSARSYPGENYMFVGCIRGQYSLMQCTVSEYFDKQNLECVDVETMARRSFAEVMMNFM
jgi:hypothetical protein